MADNATKVLSIRNIIGADVILQRNTAAAVAEGRIEVQAAARAGRVVAPEIHVVVPVPAAGDVVAPEIPVVVPVPAAGGVVAANPVVPGQVVAANQIVPDGQVGAAEENKDPVDPAVAYAAGRAARQGQDAANANALAVAV